MLKKLQRHMMAHGQAVRLWIQPFKWRLGYLLVFTFFIWYKDFHLQISLDTGQMSFEHASIDASPKDFGKTFNQNFSKKTSTKEERPDIRINPQQRSYIRRFAHVARAEMDQYGIPASITLAQGLLESQAGNSPLAKEANNHFGIKCFSKRCKKGHCRNFSDDHHKDFFRTYPSAWES
jgi:flagellum-specific peptidoglycan hydrolase FlgJ